MPNVIDAKSKNATEPGNATRIEFITSRMAGKVFAYAGTVVEEDDKRHLGPNYPSCHGAVTSYWSWEIPNFIPKLLKILFVILRLLIVMKTSLIIIVKFIIIGIVTILIERKKVSEQSKSKKIEI